MIQLLVANGCSYTRGAELVDPAREAWPAVLASALGLACVNLASDGGSNRRIVRTTVANVQRVIQEHTVAPTEALVLCLWTGLARDECHRRRRRDRGNRPGLPYEERWHRIGRWRVDEGDDASRAYFRHLWDEEGALVRVLTDWLLLDSYLSALGATPRYGYAWSAPPARTPQQASELAALIDADRVLGGSVTDADNSFYELVNGRFATGSLYHPLAEAHRYFASVLADWLRDQGLEFPR